MKKSKKPRTLQVLFEEGGLWVNFMAAVNIPAGWSPALVKHVHAIRFEDGSVWDAVNGWRDGSEKL
jgi:hypothetical protein